MNSRKLRTEIFWDMWHWCYTPCCKSGVWCIFHAPYMYHSYLSEIRVFWNSCFEFKFEKYPFFSQNLIDLKVTKIVIILLRHSKCLLLKRSASFRFFKCGNLDRLWYWKLQLFFSTKSVEYVAFEESRKTDKKCFVASFFRVAICNKSFYENEFLHKHRDCWESKLNVF